MVFRISWDERIKKSLTLILYFGDWPPTKRFGANACPMVIVKIVRAYVAAVTPADEAVAEKQCGVQNLAGIRRISRVKPQLS